MTDLPGYIFIRSAPGGTLKASHTRPRQPSAQYIREDVHERLLLQAQTVKLKPKPRAKPKLKKGK